MNLKDKLLFAIPKKGRLNPKSEIILKEAGLSYHKSLRSDIAICHNLPVAIIFLPAKDIPNYVSQGDVDLGITGRDLLLESKAKIKEQLPLNYGKCRLCLLTMDSNKTTLLKNNKLRVATSYPTLTKQFLQKKNFNLINLSGSVEIACNLGLADFVVDLVETGETLRAMGLKIVDTILTSEALLITNPNTKYKDLTKQISLRIGGVCKAKSYSLIEYNIERKNLKKGEKLTPGTTSPSLIPLEDKNWVAVRSLIKKETVAEVMEKLEKIGAKDIFTCDLQNCRI